MKSQFLAVLLFSATFLEGAAPSLINYQGLLTDINGNVVSGSKTVSVSIHDAATDGTQLYSESIGSVTVQNGVYSFQFGSGANFSTALATGSQHWLQVIIDGIAQTPRERLVSVPFAITSSLSNSLSKDSQEFHRITNLEEQLLGTQIYQHSYQNGPRPTVSNSTVWDAYVTSGGVNNLLISSPEGSFTGNQYRTKSYALQNLSEINNPDTNWNTVKTLNCENRRVEHVKNDYRSFWLDRVGRFRLVFNYTDSTSTTTSEQSTTGTSWIAVTTANPFPTKPVSSINVQLAAWGAERSTKVLSTRPITLEISLPAIAGTATRSKLVPFGNRETGDSITYKLENGSQSDDGLISGVENAFVNLTSNPTKLWITISPSTSETAIYSWALLFKSDN